MDYYRPHTAPPAGLLLRDTGLLLLRLAAGFSLLLFHAWNEGLLGWKHVWEKTPWPFAAEIAERGFPFPEAVSIIAIVAATLGSFFLITGLLCRVSAALLAVCTLCGLFLYVGIAEVAEKLVLYAVIYLVLVICGPGLFSLDSLLGGRRNARR